MRPIRDLTLLLMCACSSGVTQTAPATGEALSAAENPAGAKKPPTPDEMQIFLLFGQSNMEGTPEPEAEDSAENPRVRVLAYTSCAGREYNQWYTASPPLHSCGLGVGPGDHFGKAMAEAWPDTTIGLVPAAIAGVDIDFFRKGVVSKRRNEFRIPPDNARSGAYEMLIEKAKLAQQSGTIRGILFHQGESDTGNGEWPGKVAEVVRDLRADLGLGVDVPFVAGEVLHNGCCASHNPLVSKLSKEVPNAYVVSAEGLQGMDSAHFDLAGQRELGRRYAQAVLAALGY